MKTLLTILFTVTVLFGANSYDLPKKKELWITDEKQREKVESLLNTEYLKNSKYDEIGEVISLNRYGHIFLPENYKGTQISIVLNKKTQKVSSITLMLKNTSYETVKNMSFNEYKYIGFLASKKETNNTRVEKYITKNGNYVFIKKSVFSDTQSIIFITKEYLKEVVDTYIKDRY